LELEMKIKYWAPPGMTRSITLQRNAIINQTIEKINEVKINQLRSGEIMVQ